MNHALENTTPDLHYDKAETDAFTRSVRIEKLARELLEDPERLRDAFGDWLNTVKGKRLFEIMSEICTDTIDDSAVYELRGYIKGVAEWDAERIINGKQDNE